MKEKMTYCGSALPAGMSPNAPRFQTERLAGTYLTCDNPKCERTFHTARGVSSCTCPWCKNGTARA